ncbi:MAG: class I SAM-dependent methyltransferase [Thaumarchaeota archaeon]|nr:class I SAM-dependent methyltransferase [Nitrososphaerota archaeon]
MLEDYRKKGLGVTSRVLISTLKAKGLPGATTLELGCGVGALTLEFLKEGAASATGVDLSPSMIKMAKALAAEAGYASSSTFELGDWAMMPLKNVDIVVLDTVLCCYPDLDALLENSSGAATKYYGIAIPDDRRALTKFLKPFLPLQKIFVRRGSFRFFIHPTSKILGRLKAKGFTLLSDSKAGRIWSVFVFATPEAQNH